MRFVVVAIPDNDEADAFIEAVENGHAFYGKRAGRQGEEIEYHPQSHDWTVPQVYAVPTKFCECPDYAGKSARSTKYGWYVHVKCAKPRPGVMQHPYNLKEAHVPVKDRVYYIGFRADRKGWIPK